MISSGLSLLECRSVTAVRSPWSSSSLRTIRTQSGRLSTRDFPLFKVGTFYFLFSVTIYNLEIIYDLDPEKVNSLLSRLRENETMMTSSFNPDPIELDIGKNTFFV